MSKIQTSTFTPYPGPNNAVGTPSYFLTFRPCKNCQTIGSPDALCEACRHNRRSIQELTRMCRRDDGTVLLGVGIGFVTAALTVAAAIGVWATPGLLEKTPADFGIGYSFGVIFGAIAAGVGSGLSTTGLLRLVLPVQPPDGSE